MNAPRARSLVSRHRQAGVTLVEVMVAMVVGVVLLTGVINIFQGQKTSYRFTEGLARMQENGRFALTQISRRLRMAGYLGCASTELTQVTNKLNDSSTTPYDFGTVLEGYEAAGTAPGQTYAIPSSDPDNSSSAADWTGPSSATLPDPYLTTPAMAIPGSDVIIVRGLDDTGTSVPGKTSSGQMFACYSTTQAEGCADGSDSYNGLCEEDILLISDCRKATIFQATNMQPVGGAGDCPTGRSRLNIVHAVAAGSSTPGNVPPAWTDEFDSNAEILKITTTAFFVGKGASGSPALFQKRGNGTAEEIVDGVENLQILYGEDTDSDSYPNRYVTGDQVSDMLDVVSVRISLLLRAENTSSDRTNTQTYDLAGTTINPTDDRRMRRTMTSTIQLRNRGL